MEDARKNFVATTSKNYLRPFISLEKLLLDFKKLDTQPTMTLQYPIVEEPMFRF